MNRSLSDVVSRLLSRLDRVPFLGNGRTHFVGLALFFGVSVSFYLLVLKLRGPDATLVTWTEWDRAFPFTPWWTWLYNLVWGLGPLVAVLLRREAFVWYIQRATILVVISIVLFALVPTRTIRPLAEDNPDRAENEAKLDGLTGFLYRTLVEMDDPPANAAPSLHVSLSCLLAWALAYDRPRWWAATLLGALLVWLSTLYTAQHHLIDVITGALLASLLAIGGPSKPGSQT